MRHPETYASHRWRISRRLFADPALKLYHHMESIPSFRLPFRFERRPGYKAFHRWLEEASRTVLFEPWLYLLLAVAALFGSVATPGAEVRLARAVVSSGLLSVSHLPVTAPSTDFRYSIWLIAAALIGWLLLVRSWQPDSRERTEDTPPWRSRCPRCSPRRANRWPGQESNLRPVA